MQGIHGRGGALPSHAANSVARASRREEERDLPVRSVDLNLFRVFEAVMRHRSVAAAARELNVTASAVSHALGRLRQVLGDPLFNLTEEGMTPSPRALELAPTVNAGLSRFAAAIGSRAFDPATSGRTFRIAMSDYATTTILPPIIERIQRLAPYINLRVFPLSRKDLVENLENGQLDMAFGWFANLPRRMGRMTVTTEGEALVVGPSHPLASGPVTKEALFAYPHIVVELLGSGDKPIDGFFNDQGVERRVWIERLLLEREDPKSGLVGRVAVSLPHYSAVATLLKCGNMVATLPRRIAEREVVREGLVILKPPYDPEPVAIEAVWLQRAEPDVALQWFVTEVRAAMTALPAIDGLAVE